MVKPARKSSLSNLAKEKEESKTGTRQSRRVVSSGVRKNVTSNKAPLSIRLTDNDDSELVKWLNDVSHERGKNVTAAKLFRALIHMRDNINMKKLIDAVKEVG